MRFLLSVPKSTFFAVEKRGLTSLHEGKAWCEAGSGLLSVCTPSPLAFRERMPVFLIEAHNFIDSVVVWYGKIYSIRERTFSPVKAFFFFFDLTKDFFFFFVCVSCSLS